MNGRGAAESQLNHIFGCRDTEKVIQYYYAVERRMRERVYKANKRTGKTIALEMLNDLAEIRVIFGKLVEVDKVRAEKTATLKTVELINQKNAEIIMPPPAISEVRGARGRELLKNQEDRQASKKKNLSRKRSLSRKRP